MKNRFLLFFLFLISFSSIAQYTDRQLIINTTGYGLDKDASNGIAPEQWTYIQKFANLTYNGQDASVTAVRFHVTWRQYEPTLGNYQRTKVVQAIQAIAALKPGMKVALHFPYQRDGRINEQYFGDEDISRTADGTLVAQDVGWSIPSIFSAVGKQRFYAFVDDVLAQLAANSLMDKILYVEMGNGSAEEFANPYITINGQLKVGSYEAKAVQAWRTEYLPCRYPGQTNVTWGGNTYPIASAPVAENPWGDWSSDHQKEYHRFIAWGLMNFYKGFRDVVKNRNSALKVVYFVSDFGSQQGNMYFLHNSTLPKALQEFDGIYTSDGTWIYDLDRKIMPVDVIKGTNSNKIAAIEFDQEDLGQEKPSTSTSPIDANLTLEWMSRAYKHGVNHINLAMFFNDTQIEQLKPVFANLRANYLTPSYSPPARQTSITQNIFPQVFTSTNLFSSWGSSGGGNWSSSDNNPVSINMIDDGYWENIWSCSAVNPCDFNISASGPSGTVGAGASVTLNSTCSGQCSGVTYAWSGNSVSGSNASVTFNAPNTAGTYTYTITASKSGCSDKTSTVQIQVAAGCDFNISASASPSSVTTGGSVALSYLCTGANCSGVSYAWSGNGASGSSSPLNITVPGTAGNYTYTITASKSGCSDKTANVSVTATTGGGGENPCGYVDKQTVGTWSGLNVQTRKYTVNGSEAWLIVTAISGSSTDKHLPRGKNFADRGDISWTNGVINKTCLGGGETGFSGLVFPSGITVPSGYSQGTEQDGAVFFEQTGCSTPTAPSLSASPSSITSGGSSTLSASGCSGGTITWSDGLGTGTSKSVSPTTTKTYSATCTIGGCVSAFSNVTVTVNTGGGPSCSNLEGFFDGANCDYLNGWAYDNSSPNTVVYIDIYEGSTLIAGNIAADMFRQDLVDAGKGNGIHGFSIPVPSALKNGGSHSLTLKITGCSNFSLFNSPRTISGCSGGCTPPSAPTLSASPSTITTSGGSSTLTASGCSSGIVTWSDGLGTGTSKSVTPSSTKTYTATCSIGGCTSSNGSVTVNVNISSGGINCSTLASNVDGMSCAFIEGWLYDQSNPNAVVYADIYEGSTLLLSNVAANKFRQDLLNAGIGNGVHGLEVSTPASLKDGQSHTITVKVAGCPSYSVNNSPKTINSCSPAMLNQVNPDEIRNNTSRLSVTVNPNPNRGIFETLFYLEKGKKATIMVTDLQGRIIYRQNVSGQGMHKERINLSDKASGTLLLQLQKEGGTEIKKINIAR